ncbi:hypothetical protein SMALB_6783 [Streptomyces malaysiensis]|uniref:Uncharacterized protein n=1 Tax=Streptomyces malaysiensis TaxID=92644 RepID=A0A7X5X8M9_STRMQ|nr:hypothetical protein [Streptomyces malaysiensis]
MSPCRSAGVVSPSGVSDLAIVEGERLELRLRRRRHRLLRRPVGRGEALHLVPGLFGFALLRFLCCRVLVGRPEARSPGLGHGRLGLGEGLAGLGHMLADRGGELTEAHDFQGEVVGPFAEGGPAFAGPVHAGHMTAQVGADVEDLRAGVA